MNNIIELFFSKKFENEINNKLLDYSYKFPQNDVLNYVNKVINISINDYLQFLNNSFSYISFSVKDVPQFSNFENSLDRLVEKMIENGDKGFKHIEIGALLLDDGIIRKAGALTKYGENHVKTSVILGYCFELNKHYYVSCLGYILKDLTKTEKEKLLLRLIIRTSLFRIVYSQCANGEVNLRETLDFLSDSTYKRRLSNVKYIFNKLYESDEYDFSLIKKKILF